ncbi:MAG TPA: antitoxin [Micromonosporaceae bacterium]
MTDFLHKAEQFAEDHPEQVDKGLDRAGREVEERTDHRYDTEVDKAEQVVERRFGHDDPSPQQP